MAEFYVILGCLGTLIMISSSWNATPNWFLFLSNLAMNCFFTQGTSSQKIEETPSLQ